MLYGLVLGLDFGTVLWYNDGGLNMVSLSYSLSDTVMDCLRKLCHGSLATVRGILIVGRVSEVCEKPRARENGGANHNINTYRI